MRMRAYLVCALAFFGAPLTHSRAEDLAATNCTCYYGYDEECGPEEACDRDWNPINCQRRQPEGGMPAGACSDNAAQSLVAPCDANCSPKTKHYCQSEDPNNITQSLELWRQAMTQPGLAGGGSVNRILATQARDVTVSPVCSEYLGWRVLGVMELCRGNGYVTHPAQYDEIEDHILGSLVGDSCRIDSGNKCVAAIKNGIFYGETAVDPIIDGIAASCPGGLPFGNSGLPATPLEGVKKRLRVTSFVLSPTEVPATSMWGVLGLAAVLVATGALAIRRS